MTLALKLSDLATRLATESKALRTLVNGNAGNLNALNTTAKNNLVAAINEVLAAIAGGGGAINDGTTTGTSTWSSTKVAAEILAAKNALINGSAAALDTLNELAAALGNDANFAATTATALGNRVRADSAQSFTAPQQAQARSNIGAQEAAAIGDPEQNLVAIFEAGLL
jgi:hypothetical protein